MQTPSSSNTDSSSVVAMNESGHTLFKKTFIHSMANFIVSLKVTHDKHLAYYGYSFECDTGPYQHFFVKLDTNGNEVFHVQIPQLFNQSGEIGSDFVQHQDSSYYLFYRYKLFHLSKYGQYLDDTTTVLNSIRGIECLNNGNLLLSGTIGNAGHLLEITTQYQTINLQNSNGVLNQLTQASNGWVYALSTSKSLKVYDSNLQSVNLPMASPLSSLTIQSFYIKNDSVFVVGNQNQTTGMVYAVLNSSLQTVHQNLVQYSNIIPASVGVNDHRRVTVINNCSSSSQTLVPYTSVYQFPIFGGYSSTCDVGVEDIELLKISSAGYSNSLNFEIKVMVKNYGGDTIHFFNIHRYFNDHFCMRNVLVKPCHVTLLPYQSCTVSSGEFLLSLPYTSPTMVNFCFYTSAPNSENDTASYNDGYCKNLMIPIGLKEFSDEANYLQVFPNPFTPIFTIQSEYEIKEVKVFNALGVLVRRETSLGKEAVLELEELKPGIYFVRIETEKGAVTKKVIKE